ncbi:hypothetical protein CRENBAI_000404 [Crenichthys baileyi]|uniref:Uncharacterized protein n=1 Tax=Crenichthys baileyi TaxID=28760 RepID=A0AAV9SCN7_9TELE
MTPPDPGTAMTPPGPCGSMTPSDQAMEGGHSHCLRVKKVLNLLMELRDQHKEAQPISSAVHVERMATIEDLEREEERLCDPKAFDALVGFKSGRNR